MSFPSMFTEQEQGSARRFLAELGIHERGGALDAIAFIGYLSAVIRYALIEFPGHEALRIAAARIEQYEHLVYAAALSSDPLTYSRPEEVPVAGTPPDGVDGVQLGTRALAVCMVDPVTGFCRTHQGTHDDAFAVLAGIAEDQR